MPKKKTEKIELRISAIDKETLQSNAIEIGMSLSKFMIAAALGQNLPASRTDRGVRKELMDIKRELDRIGNSLDRLTEICQTSRQLGEPVSVNMQTIESTEKIVTRGIELIDRYLLNQTNKNRVQE